MSYHTPLTALADPTRRALFERVRRRPHTVGELAKALEVSQPAVSQHLRVLRKAHLLSERREGTKRFVSASPAGLRALRRWLDGMWDEALEKYAEGGRPRRRS